MTEPVRQRWHRRVVADHYGFSRPDSVTRRVTRGAFPKPDGHDANGAWWYADTLPATLPSRPMGRPPQEPRTDTEETRMSLHATLVLDDDDKVAVHDYDSFDTFSLGDLRVALGLTSDRTAIADRVLAVVQQWNATVHLQAAESGDRAAGTTSPVAQP